jgi:hypothetical protein
MPFAIRRISSCLCFGLCLVACTPDDGDGDGETAGGTDDPTTTVGTTSPTTSATTMGTTSPTTTAGEASSTDPTASDDSSSGDVAEESSSSGGDGESGSTDTGALEYDPEFIWVADFLRVNCTGCHATNKNGNLVLGGPDIDNEGIRLALDGVVALTGLLLVQPGDHTQSQTWLQITNEFGAVFPVEDTDRFAAWIDAGANYYAQ